MRKLIPIAAVAILCACTRTEPKNTQPVYPPHNRTIESPVYGAKSVATHKVKIDKIEITDSLTRLYVSNLDVFKLSAAPNIVVNGQKLEMLSADTVGILSGTSASAQNDESGTQFILNFQDVDSTVQTIDFIDTDIKFWNIALNDNAAAKIKAETEVPDEIVRQARTVSNDTAGLEKQCLMDGYAIVEGKIYGYHPQAFGPGAHWARILNSSGGRFENFALIADDGSFKFEIPITKKRTDVSLSINNTSAVRFYLACNDTVRVDIDLKKIDYNYNRVYPLRLASYFSGANAEINNYDFPIVGDFSLMGMDTRVNINKMRGMTLNQYKEYILKLYNEKLREVNYASLNATELDIQPMNRKIKEMYNHILRRNAVELLMAYNHYIGRYDSDGKLLKPDAEYYNFVKDLCTGDDELLLTNCRMMYRISCELNGIKNPFEKTRYDVVSKEGEPLAVERRMSKKEEAALKMFREQFGFTKPLYSDMWVAARYYPLEHLWSEDFEKMSDTAMAVIKTLSDPYFLQHALNLNNGMFNSKTDEKSYWQHTDGESVNDSIFVELIKNFKGKVVFLDFWSQTCRPCIDGIEELKKVEKDLPMDSIAIIYICEDKTTTKEVFEKQSEKWSNTNYRLNFPIFSMIYGKLGFSGYPNNVIINKKGQIIKKYKGYYSRGTEIIKGILTEEAAK